MLRYYLSCGLLILSACVLHAQSIATEMEVYEFSDGLSHRNVFRIRQDQTGMIWMATINGLNSFDGYQFRHYHPESEEGQLPAEM